MSNVIDRTQQMYSVDPQIVSVIDELDRSLRLGGITDPRRAATDIIAALLDVPRSWPVINRESSIDIATVTAARRAAEALCRGAPFAYAVGCVQFRNLQLSVDERVLIPRPETEILVGEVIERMSANFGAERWGTAVDIGTGSGAIALALATEGRFDSVIATDASADALAVASANRDRCLEATRTPVELRAGSLLAPVADIKATAMVSNPPYISYAEMQSLPASVRDWEPSLALFSGHDGMSATTAIVRDAHTILVSGGILALEADERRASLVAELMMRHGSYTDIGVRLDLTGRERFVFATRI